MALDAEDVLVCLRNKSAEDLAAFDFGTPLFLSAMGPSRDGILIPADFGADTANYGLGVEGVRRPLNKRANMPSYQVSTQGN
jgi:hypothetical protein